MTIDGLIKPFKNRKKKEILELEDTSFYVSASKLYGFLWPHERVSSLVQRHTVVGAHHQRVNLRIIRKHFKIIFTQKWVKVDLVCKLQKKNIIQIKIKKIIVNQRQYHAKLDRKVLYLFHLKRGTTPQTEKVLSIFLYLTIKNYN